MTGFFSIWLIKVLCLCCLYTFWATDLEISAVCNILRLWVQEWTRCNRTGINGGLKTGPHHANQFQVDEIAVSGGEGVKPHLLTTKTHKRARIEPRTHTHPLSRDHGYIYLGHSRGENLKTKERARTRRQQKIQGLRELVANAGDGSSLVTRRATHHCLPLLHPQCCRQFSLPVWLPDLFPLLILLPPTKNKLNEDGIQAAVLLVSTSVLLGGFARGLAGLYTFYSKLQFKDSWIP